MADGNSEGPRRAGDLGHIRTQILKPQSYLENCKEASRISDCGSFGSYQSSAFGSPHTALPSAPKAYLRLYKQQQQDGGAGGANRWGNPPWWNTIFCCFFIQGVFSPLAYFQRQGPAALLRCYFFYFPLQPQFQGLSTKVSAERAGLVRAPRSFCNYLTGKFLCARTYPDDVSVVSSSQCRERGEGGGGGKERRG